MFCFCVRISLVVSDASTSRQTTHRGYITTTTENAPNSKSWIQTSVQCPRSISNHNTTIFYGPTKYKNNDIYTVTWSIIELDWLPEFGFDGLSQVFARTPIPNLSEYVASVNGFNSINLIVKPGSHIQVFIAHFFTLLQNTTLSMFFYVLFRNTEDSQILCGFCYS